MSPDIVKETIDNEEVLVRAILHPLFCSASKERLNENAFSPPPAKPGKLRNDVSVLRLSYTTPTNCKNFAKNLAQGINKQSYFGLATLVVGSLGKAFEHTKEDVERSDIEIIEVEVSCTPLDINNEIRIERPIYRNDPGLPFHADIVYNFEPKVGEPLPFFLKLLIKKLINPQYSTLYKDNNPTSLEWNSGDLIE